MTRAPGAGPAPIEVETLTLRPPVAYRPHSLLAAILSDRPAPIAQAARAAGIACDCADAQTLWLLPYNAPRILFLDLPVTGVTPRRLALLLRQLCRANPDMVIAAHNPSPDLPCDIAVESLSDDALSDTFAEARHFLRPVPNRRSLFYPAAPKRASLFR